MEKKLRFINAHPFKRLLALLVDTLVLGSIGALLGVVLSSWFFALGQNGWWIGFLISLVYYSVLETAVNKGQTLGGKLIGLSVVSTKGGFLDLKNALLRNFMLLVLFYNTSYGAFIPITNIFLVSMFDLIIGIYAFTFFVFILFHPQHKGLHDILTGAYVVNRKNYAALSKGDKKAFLKKKFDLKKPKKISHIGAIVIFAVIAVIAIINPFKNSPLGNLLAVRDVINKDAGVQDSSVVVNTVYGPTGKKNMLIISVQVNRETFTDQKKLNALRQQIIKQVFATYPHARGLSGIVNFNSGYSIGIWSFNENAQ